MDIRLNLNNLDIEINKTLKYIIKSNKNIDKIKKELECTICYERLIEKSYQCNNHKVCKICYYNIELCPYCRAFKIGVYPDFWIKDINNEFIRMTDDMINNGINNNFIYRYDYLDSLLWCIYRCLYKINYLNRNNKIVIFNHIIKLINDSSNFPICYFISKIRLASGKIDIILNNICLKINKSIDDVMIVLIKNKILDIYKEINNKLRII